jgi:hypothetical protein
MEKYLKLMRLVKPVKNSAHDRRTKYGIQAQAVFPEGMLWMITRNHGQEESMLQTLSKLLPDPAEREKAIEEERIRWGHYTTPYGQLWITESDADRKAFLANSVPTEAVSVNELAFIYGMQHLTAVELLQHLKKVHGWKLDEVEQVFVEIDQAQLDAPQED